MSTSCATVRTEWLNHIGTRLALPGRNNHFRGKCELSRRGFAFNGIVAAGASVMTTSVVDEPSKGLEKLPFKPEGYNYWTWRGHKIHYVVEGEGFPVVLIHGFGASAFHWRYNIPELAKKYKVYALDLIGFGWSEKALIEYDALVWRDQIADFLKEIVKEPAVLVGNSLGGFAALVAAASLTDQVKGVTLLNSAGQFEDASSAAEETEETALQIYILKPLKESFQRVFLGFLFWQAKQPARIESVLKSVYINSSNVDDYLINSITRPAADPNAGEVYYRLMTRFMSNQRKYTLDNVLRKLSCPLLLVWGDLDPWVGPAKANRIKEFYPNTTVVNLKAGHCPHDEVPELVNEALLDWLSTTVYINSSNVDDYLINSIIRPAADPNAREVYYRLITRFLSNLRKYTLDNVLRKLSCPLLLVWGDLDPLAGPAQANRIKEFYPNTTLVNLKAGHCPHDEVPELVNEALLEWLSSTVTPVSSLETVSEI